MKIKVIRFEFGKNPLHIGTVRQDYAQSESMLHSDSLYAAIMHVWGMLGEEIPDNGDPGFSISSLFPFTHVLKESSDGKTKLEPVYFWPKPYLVPNNTKDVQDQDRKKVKKIKWLDTSYFSKYINGTAFNGFESQGTKENSHIQGEFLSAAQFNWNLEKEKCPEKKKDDDSLFMKSHVYPRVKVPRNLEDKTEIFYIERINFLKEAKAGFYCLYDCKDDSVTKKVEKALDVLETEGIGTDRSVGHGQFKWSWGDIYMDVPEPSGFYTNLSLFLPENPHQLSEMLDENARYDIIRRGGWISKHPFQTYKKQEIYMFREGGIFSMKGKETPKISGYSKDIAPDIVRNKENAHEIWRCGKSIFLPVNLHP